MTFSTAPKQPPPYIAASSFEPSQPPFVFDDVASRVFPLRAEPERLRRFCDDYINVVPPEISHCRPVAPYVFLAILSYGRMASREQAAGWVAQNEVFFSFPVEWRHRDDEGREVVELASVTPYLFVDESLSLVTGREVYGWPKMRAWFEPDIETWTADTVGRPRALRMDTLLFPHAYAGRRPRRRTLLEIEPDPVGDPMAWPPQLDVPGNPLWVLRQGLEEGFRLARDVSRTLALQGSVAWLPGLMQGLGDTASQRLTGDLSDLLQLPRWISRTLHIKQFPDARKPGRAAYQALVSAPMEALDLHGGGLLGTPPLLRGDASGGFRIHLHHVPELPIATSLGIETTGSVTVEDRHDSTRGRTRGPRHSPYLSPLEQPGDPDRSAERWVSEMRPVFPYWLNLDLEYGCGHTETWRTPGTDWSERATAGPPSKEPLPLQRAAGGILTALQGPFHFLDVTVRTLVLDADPEALQRFLDRSLNRIQDLWAFEPHLDGVLLMSYSFGITESDSNDVGWWADREVGLWLLLRGKETGASRDVEPDGENHLFLTSPYLFTNSLLGSLTFRETFGVPQIHAHIVSPGHPWMEQEGPIVDEGLVRVHTDVFQALQAGQRSHQRVLLEVLSRTPEERSVPQEHGMFSPIEAPTGALPALPSQARTVFVKQFRDAARPDRAGYQALMLGDISFDNLHLRPLDAKRLEVRLHRYPSHPMVRELGLRVSRTERRPSTHPGRVWEGRPVDVLLPREAFWLTADLTAGYSDEEIRLFPQETR